MGSYISSKVELGRSKIGKGLFAKENIPKGEVVVDFTGASGKFLSTKEADVLYDQGDDYMIQVDDDLYFAATTPTELEDADYTNHSCDPNCGIQGSLRIVTMRKVQKDEEITIDYAMTESSDYVLNCLCKTTICRKIITGNDWNLKRLQKKYANYFSDYLKEKINLL